MPQSVSNVSDDDHFFIYLISLLLAVLYGCSNHNIPWLHRHAAVGHLHYS